MARRHFLHSVNSIGVGALSPLLAMAPPNVPRIATPSNSSSMNEGKAGFQVGLVGVGGAGVNVLSVLIGRLPSYFRMIAINTDASSRHNMPAYRKILVGGIPDNPARSEAARRSIVRRNAWSAADQIAEAVAGLNMLLIVAGMGGMAGTMISPVVAQVASKRRAVTIGVPIFPFDWEGNRRNQVARDGAREFGRCVDSMFPISNDAIAQSAGVDASMDDVFSKVSMVVRWVFLRASATAQLRQFLDE